jgi:hypothetical protein
MIHIITIIGIICRRKADMVLLKNYGDIYKIIKIYGRTSSLTSVWDHSCGACWKAAVAVAVQGIVKQQQQRQLHWCWAAGVWPVFS